MACFALELTFGSRLDGLSQRSFNQCSINDVIDDEWEALAIVL